MASIAAASGVSFVWSSLRYTVFGSIHFDWNFVNWVLSWRWQSWLSFWSVVMIGVIFKGTVDTVERREKIIREVEKESLDLDAKLAETASLLEEAKKQSAELQKQLSEARSLCVSLQKQKESLQATLPKVPNLSISLRTEQTTKAIVMDKSQFDYQKVLVHPSIMTLLIYSHGSNPVVLSNYKLWKLHAVEKTKEEKVHNVAKPGDPVRVDITNNLLEIIAGTKNPTWTDLPGTYQIRICVAYSDGTSTRDADPHDFKIICKQVGGTALHMEAEEIHS